MSLDFSNTRFGAQIVYYERTDSAKVPSQRAARIAPSYQRIFRHTTTHLCDM